MDKPSSNLLAVDRRPGLFGTRAAAEAARSSRPVWPFKVQVRGSSESGRATAAGEAARQRFVS